MPINSPDTSFIKSDAKGAKLFVRVTPKAAKSNISDIFIDADGQEYLKISLNAPPIDGAANAALIKILAKKLHLPGNAFTITAGLTSRKKVVSITMKESELRNILCPHP